MTATQYSRRAIVARSLLLLALLAAAPFVLFYAGRGIIEFAGDVLQRQYKHPGRMVAVGNHKLSLYCVGTGRPAVVIETGMAAAWSDWHVVVSRLASTSEVCVYDRAGYGWSEPGPMPRTALAEAEDLHRLVNADVDAPLIIVAHSYGGYIARIYASRFGESLAGMVLVDPAIEGEPLSLVPWFRRIMFFFPPTGAQRLVHLVRGPGALPPGLAGAPKEFQARFLTGPSVEQQKAERSELASLPQSEADVRAARLPRDLPLTVITARHLISPREYYPPPVPEPPPSHQAFHERLSHQSLRGKYVIAESSGHQIELDQPELIIEAVEDMMSEFRGARN